jgi:hypothetical protein
LRVRKENMFGEYHCTEGKKTQKIDGTASIKY